MGHAGVEWVMQGWGASCRGVMGWIMQGWENRERKGKGRHSDGPHEFQGYSPQICSRDGVGWVMQGWIGWGGSCRGGVGGSCRVGGVGHIGVGLGDLCRGWLFTE